MLTMCSRTRRNEPFTIAMAGAAFEGMAASGPRANATEWASRFGEPGFETVDLSDLIGSFGTSSRGEDAGGASIFEDLMGRVRGARPGRQRRSYPGSPPDNPFLDRRPRRRDDHRSAARPEQDRKPCRQDPARYRYGGQTPAQGPGRAGFQRNARGRFDNYDRGRAPSVFQA